MNAHAMMIRFSTILLLTASACGDDGDDGGGATDTSGTTGATMMTTTTTTGMTTDTPPDDTTTSDGSTTAITSADTTGDTTSAPLDDSTSSGDTGEPRSCEEIDEDDACNMTLGCTWVGSPNQGSCVPTADMCTGVMFQMQCNFIPGCAWNEETKTCMPTG